MSSGVRATAKMFDRSSRPATAGLRRRRSAAAVVAAYALVGVAWILLSDSLLRILLPGRTGELVASVKGIGFVVVTAIALWAVLAARDRLLARAERERAAAIEATTAIFASSPLAIIAIDPRGCVTAWSPAAERVLGWPADRVVGRPAAVLRPDDPAWIDLTVARVMAGETLFGIPLDYVHSDGGSRHLDLFAAPLRGEDGSVRGAVVVAQDVTAERAAQAERNLLTAAIEHAAEAIVVTDPAGDIIYVNPAFEQIGPRS